MKPLSPETDTVNVFYHTGIQPPPYAHQYSLTMKFKDDRPEVEFRLEYLDREDLTEEDLYEEGFSNDDDYSWNGKLHSVWQNEFKRQIEKANWTKETKKNDGYGAFIEFTFFENGEEKQALHPADPKDWDYFLQEIIQAIFEESNREMPLEISLVDNDGVNVEHHRVHVSFARREVVLEVEKNTKQHNRKTLEWESAKHLMKTLYMLEPDFEKAREKQPDKPGMYVQMGDGLWYDWHRDIHEPSEDHDFKDKFLDLLNE